MLMKAGTSPAVLNLSPGEEGQGLCSVPACLLGGSAKCLVLN